MTTTEAQPQPTTDDNANTWPAEFPVLKNRFAGKKDSILFCIHALQATPEIKIEDAKQQAATHGIRVTAASLNAAKTLLDPKGNTAAPRPRPAAQGHAGRPQRPRANDVDAEALIRGVVEKIEQQGNVLAERLKATVRKAIAMLEAVVAS
jgi:hypothetical protein